MFGYLKPFTPDLRVSEHEAYKSVYCGLCHQLGKGYGFFSRMTLSYDFAFMSMLLMSLDSDAQYSVEHKRCASSPFRKKCSCKTNPYIDFSATAAVILVYYKNIDSINDSKLFGKISHTALSPLLYRSYRRAKKSLPDIESLVAECSRYQAEVERRAVVTIDEACEPTANMIAGFIARFAKDDAQKRILERFGYFLGRYVYLMDAIDDLEDDKKNNGFNPFIIAQKTGNLSDEELLSRARQIINLTLGEIATTYNLLDIYHFKSIIDNFIYQGFSHTFETIILNPDKKPESRKEPIYDRPI